MSITFASGGFSGTMRSDADGNIFVETQGDSKTITIGSIAAYTGSDIKELDPSTGNVLFQKEYKSDGTIEEAKFKASGERMETKVKNPSDGKEFIAPSFKELIKTNFQNVGVYHSKFNTCL